MKRQVWGKIKKQVYDFSKLKPADAAFLQRMSEEKDVYPVVITFKEVDDFKRLWFYFTPLGEVENEEAEIRFLDKIPFWQDGELYGEDSELTHPIRVGEDWVSLKVKMSCAKIPLAPETRYKAVLSTAVYENFTIGAETYTGWTIKMESLAPLDAVVEVVEAHPIVPSKASKRSTESLESVKPTKKPKSMLELTVDPDSPTSEVYVDLDPHEMEKQVREHEERVREVKRTNRSRFGKI